MDYLIGLDIGPNSIGWSCIDKDAGKIINTGVRIFPEAVKIEKSGQAASKCTKRRTNRGLRRTHHRKNKRQEQLVKVLKNAGMLYPQSAPELEQMLVKSDPYLLRKKGLDEKLELFELRRALCHINRRRGFKSNRKSMAQKESPKVGKAISSLEVLIKAAGARTLGEYFAGCLEKRDAHSTPHSRIDKEGVTFRVRDNYTSRKMYQDEFELLWSAQQQFHPQLLTAKLKSQITDEIIFFQRPFYIPEDKVGYCQFEPSLKRAAKGSFPAQQFIMLQEINNLRIIAADGKARSLSDTERSLLQKELGVRSDLKLEQLKKKLEITEPGKLNLERHKKSIPGNKTAASLKKALGKGYASLHPATRDDLICAILADDNEALAQIGSAHGLSAEQMEALYKTNLPSGHIKLSLVAVKKLLPHLEQGLSVPEACKLEDYQEARPLAEELLGQIPRLVDPLSKEAQTEPEAHYIAYITNPVVKRALTQVRQVVNMLISEYGKPQSVVVELAREARNNITRRNKIFKENCERRAINDAAKATIISDYGIAEPKYDDIQKYKLWLELGQSHNCPFTGRPISASQLFGSGEIDVEHIIPYSRCYDDSFMNKTLCFSNENRSVKGNKTPFEAYSEDPERYQQILGRAQKLPYSKMRRFRQTEVDTDKFISRHLNDTQYISKEVIRYLKTTIPKVRCCKGTITATLRHHWGLNNILNPNGDKKSREDHRHHAVDAIVIALADSQHIRRLAYVKNPRQPKQPLPPPWDGFRRAVEVAIDGVTVSRKMAKKVRGQLHEETFYGETGLKNEQGVPIFSTRKPVNSLTDAMVEKIRDPVIQKLVRAYRQDKSKPKGPLLMPSGVPINKVRINVFANSMVQVAPHRFAPSGGNHHIAIFEGLDKKGQKKRYGAVTSLFEASTRRRHREEIICRTHPEQPAARFLFSLAINETMRITIKEGESALYRVQQISQQIILRPINFAGDLKDTTNILYTVPNTLKGQKVIIDPIGREFPAYD